MSAKSDIAAFKRVNGERYDYSGYNLKTRLVRCRLHGEFKITAANHLAGVQCRECSRVTRWRARRRKLETKARAMLPADHRLVAVVAGDPNPRMIVECELGQSTQGLSYRNGFTCALHREAERARRAKARKPSKPAEAQIEVGFTTPEVWERRVEHHRTKYPNYSYPPFDGSLLETEIKVTCDVHGDFIYDAREKQPHCPTCKYEELRMRRTTKAQEAVARLGCSHLVFLSVDAELLKARIKCTKHELETEVRIENIRSNSTLCSQCKGERKSLTAMKDLLRKFHEAHGNRYDYSQVVYRGAGEKVTVICREHGPWETLPGNHYQGSGCWKCFSGASSKPERDWMAAIGKKLGQKQSPTARVPGRKGGVCEADATFRNVVVEFDGVYWHSREGSKAKDEYKNRKLRAAGYHVIRLRNRLPPVKGAHCFTVTEEPDDETVTEVAELIRELQKQPVSPKSPRRSS